MQTRVKTAHIISIVNQKGGVGKTTTALNLASFISESGKKTLLIDLDPQANATSGIGINLDKVTLNIYDVMLQDAPIEDTVYPTVFDHLHLIPASASLAGAEVELTPIVSRETILKRFVGRISDQYDYIIIDCAPSLGLLTLNALSISTELIIPVQCEYYALEGLAKLTKTIGLVKKRMNPNLNILGIVLTMFDRRTTLNRQVAIDAKNYFNELIFDTIIPRNIRLAESPSFGLPIALYAPESSGSIAYYNLSKEVINRVDTN